MRRPRTAPTPDRTAVARVAHYRELRARVEDAHRELRATTARRHTPAEAQAAADALNAALHAATTVALACLRSACNHAPLNGQVRTLRHVPPAVETWMAELTELGVVRTELLTTTLTEPGLEVAEAVQVGSRAADGPHQAGLTAESASYVARRLPLPRIGVPLRATVQAR